MRGIRAVPSALLAAVLLPMSAAAAEPVAVECPPIFFAEAGDVECLEIEVPERDGTDKAGYPVTLFISILRAESEAARVDPIVYLAGGPGATAAEAAPLLAGSSLRVTRDVILFEQRGTALTDPYLGCPALDLHEAFFSVAPGTDERFAEVVGSAAAGCAEAHELNGIDLSAFTTAASAEDLEVVRRALGIESWNLYAGSYGTRLALEVLRRHPESVRSAVLDAVDAPDHDRIARRTPNLAAVVAAADDACASDPSCAARFGDLESLLARALNRWRDEPTTVYAPYSADAYTELIVDAGAVASLTYSTLAADPAALPLLLEQLAAGDTTVLELTDIRPGLVAEGMRLSVECAESMARTDREVLRANDASDPDLGLAFRRFPEAVACDRWPVGPAPASAADPVASDVPVLLVSGELDPITPPSAAEGAARTLGRARHHVVSGGGHGAGLSDPCAIEVRDAFFADPEAPLPLCDATATFITDVISQPGIAAAWRAVFVPTPQVPSPLPAIAGLGGGLGVVLAAAGAALLRGSRSWAVRALAVFAGLLLGVGTVIGWTWLSFPPLVGMVGLPSLLAWLPWASSAVAGLGFATLMLVGVAVVHGRTGGRTRLLLAVSAFPVAAGVWILAAYDLALPPL